MQHLDLKLTCPIEDTFRVKQIAAMFDLDPSQHTCHRVHASVPDLSDSWRIGAIVGPSGSGKTALARHAFADFIHRPHRWPAAHAVIDCMGRHPIRRIVGAFIAVGFSSPPAWLKPFALLSTGQQFRCELARALLDSAATATRQKGAVHEVSGISLASEATRVPHAPTNLVVIDEFTSTLDRIVARTVSLALSRSIRANKFASRVVAVTCHEDILPWLRPDWVIDLSPGAGRDPTSALARKGAYPLFPHKGAYPLFSFDIKVVRASTVDWELFRPHHYLSGNLHPSASCFLATVDNRPAAFTAVLPFPHPTRPGYREHRTVCLPDYQGIGIGSHLSDSVAAMYVATGKPYFSRTSHPAWIRKRIASTNWRLIGRIGMVGRNGLSSSDTTEMRHTNSRGRLTAGFEYIGAPNQELAKQLKVHPTAATTRATAR
jgi:GNAT superfamily N-acetyltransferase